MAPLRAHFTLLHNSKIVGNFAHQFKGAVFTPVLKGVDTQVVHTHSLIVGAVADHIPLKQGLRPKNAIQTCILFAVSQTIFH